MHSENISSALKRAAAFLSGQIEKARRDPARAPIIIVGRLKLALTKLGDRFNRTFPPAWHSRYRYVGCFLAFLFVFFLAISGRYLFSALATAAFVQAIVYLSKMKYKYMHMYLHAYDFIFFVPQLATMRFALDNVRFLIARPAGVLAAAMVILSALYALEPIGISRLYPAAALPVMLAILLLARARLPAREFWMPFFDPWHLVNFLESVPEAWHACLRGGVMATQHSGAAMPQLRVEAVASPKAKLPTIIVILQESIFPPALYPQVRYDRELDRFFRSGDGVERLLRVETFGSGTWMTEFSLLTGIPATSYGVFRAHIFHWVAGKMKHTLPQLLREQGYRTAVHYSSSFDVMSADRFFRSMGFDELIDRHALGLPSDNEPDNVRYDCALDWLGGHFATTDAPAFLYMLTSANHFPHDVEFLPERRSRYMADDANSVEVNEYLRRLSFSVEDFEDFRAELARRFPERELLIAHFGDHQPPLNWGLLDEERTWLGSFQRMPSRELAFLTYFAVEGINFTPKIPNDLPATIEIAYLGTALMLAAGVPLDAVHKLRRELMVRHGGRLYFIDNGGVASQLNQQLIDAGLVLPH